MARKRPQGAKRGVPRKAANANRKAKYARYRKRSTCWCGKEFRSPSKVKLHELRDH